MVYVFLFTKRRKKRANMYRINRRSKNIRTNILTHRTTKILQNTTFSTEIVNEYRIFFLLSTRKKNPLLFGMVEKWDPVLGTGDPGIPGSSGTPSTSGSHGPLVPLDPRTSWDLRTLGKLPPSFEIQNLSAQKL